ncbi:MAG: hypothetical protein MR534_09290 [Prevotellaceae bacterium]|nr:hypothetical protein [Prevotellaceae bacterium]
MEQDIPPAIAIRTWLLHDINLPDGSLPAQRLHLPAALAGGNPASCVKGMCGSSVAAELYPFNLIT